MQGLTWLYIDIRGHQKQHIVNYKTLFGPSTKHFAFGFDYINRPPLSPTEVPYGGGVTNTEEAFMVTRTQCFGEQNGDRDYAPNVVIIITDGIPTAYTAGDGVGSYCCDMICFVSEAFFVFSFHIFVLSHLVPAGDPFTKMD